MRNVLITGACGMIGSYVVRQLLKNGYNVIGVDRCEGKTIDDKYVHIRAELSDAEALAEVFNRYELDRVIHLAALAHTPKGVKLTRTDYYNANVACARNVFVAAARKKIPVLFISTADVYGFTSGAVDSKSVPKPVTDYAKTKVLAERELADICKAFECEYDIFRFAPVYTDEIRKDIQKRYYLKYPNLAYIIGKGTGYEFLSIKAAAEKMTAWVDGTPTNSIHNIKNESLINTAECIEEEKSNGRAKYVLHFPKWLVNMGYHVILVITGKNKYTYLLGKAVKPIRTR